MSSRRKLVAAVAAAAAVLGTSSLALCVGDGHHQPAAAATRDAPSSAPTQDVDPADDDAPPAVRLDRGPLLSPLTPDVVAHLRQIASRYDRSDDVFAKVGDSATVSRAFLECFGGDEDEVDLGSASELMPTVEYFRGGNAGGIDPFRRDSEAADVGWSARQLLVGNPPPLLREVRAISPRFAFALNGGNDVEGRDVERFANRMLRLVDDLTTRGVVPILGTIIPRGDDPEAERWVRRYNGVVRAIAAGKKVPLIDFHQALGRLPRQGLAGDHVHPNVLIAGGETHPCDLTDNGLQYGNNVRNLLALRTLDRLRRTVIEGQPAPDRPRPALRGNGSARAPFEVRTLPFTDVRSTAGSEHRDLDRYPCGAEHDESGPEYVYRLQVDHPLDLRAWVFSEGGVDVDVHLLDGSATEDACVARDDTQVIRMLEPGTWFVTVDTFVDDEGAHSGDFLLVLDVEDAG